MVRDVLSRHHIAPDTERGQHFLDSGNVVEQMVEAAELETGETVLEIGAGVGTITKQLAEAAGTVLAYENDSALVNALDDELEGYDNVDVREEDALKADVPEFDACVSNIPFHRSSDILDFLVERGCRSVLLVQQEFADRLVAEPGEDAYSRTTVLANYRFVPAFLDSVPRTAFYPEMDVDAALVKLFPRNESFAVDDEVFREVTRALFVHAKKKVRNAFYDSRHFFEMDKDEAKGLRDELPHSEERVRELGVRALAEISVAVDEAVH